MFKGTSLFGQITSIIDRAGFHRIVTKHQADKHAKGFSCWHQCVSMLYCHLEGAKSLREICYGLATVTGKIVHLGLRTAPKKSTLAYANEHKPYQVYVDLFENLAAMCAAKWTGKRKFRFKNKLYSMDATVIELCATMFPWAKFRQTKGAVKVHQLLDHDGYLPVFAHITDGKTHEINVARDWAANYPFPQGSIIAFDRGYNDYDLFLRWHERGIWFVTRMKDGTRYDLLEKNPIPDGGTVLQDERIVLIGPKALTMPLPDFRRIVIWDEVNQREIVLLTNHQEFAASTVAKIYKERWQIEIFFSTFAWSLSNLIALLRPNLFTYRDLFDWLNDPFKTPPREIEIEIEQLSLGV